MNHASGDQVAAIAAILLEAEAAHGQYEATELNGVYDAEWPRWYAAYALEHGLGAVVRPDLTTDGLAQLLSEAYAAYQRDDPGRTEHWSTYVARRVAAE